MTRSELRTLVLQWLDDVNGEYFTSTIVNTWLENAQREVQKLLLMSGDNYYVKVVETSTVASQADYALPTDFFDLNRLELVVSGTGTSEDRRIIYPVTLNQQGLLGNALGTPEAYAIKKSRFTLFPTPDSVKTLRLYYSPTALAMSADGDEPDVPEQYHELVAILAAYNGFIKDDRSPANLELKKQEYIKLMKQAAETRLKDQSRHIIITDDDFAMSW